MEATIERLRMEKAEAGQNLFNQGKKDGFQWANNSHYLMIQAALAWDPKRQEFPDDEDLCEELREMISEDTDLGFEYVSGKMTDETYQWAKGWVEGVNEFWDQVKGKV